MIHSRHRFFALVTAGVLSVSSLALSGCEEKKGPLEEAGESADEAISDTKRAVEDAAD